VPRPAPPRDETEALRAIARAIELQRAGRLDDAEGVYASLLARDDRDATVLVNAGVLALARNDVTTSVGRLTRAVEIAPNNAVARANLGFALIRAGRDAEALASLDRAVALKPDFAQAHNNRGIALVRLKRREDAIAAFTRALGLLPAYADAAINLGELRNRAGDTTRAREAFERVRRDDPASANARIGLAFADALDGKLEDAIASLEAIVAAHPNQAAAWHTLGAVRNWAWRHDQAEDAFRRAVAIDPSHGDARFGIASTLLARGRYREGFDAFEASRSAFPASTVLRALPRWNGEPLAGTLVVHGEQGLGDVVQFARFVPRVAQRVERVVLFLDGYWKPLAPLLATLRGVDAIATDERDLEGLRARARASMLSLPHHEHAELGALPVPPYLAVPADRRDRWRARVEAHAAPRVGIAWSVFARDDHGYVTRHKSIAASGLAPLLEVEGVSFLSLQPGAAGDPASLGAHAGRVAPTGREIADFGDTAALVDAMDLVISVDTAVAHVAGALGKTAWLLERFHGCWRWRVERETSPWYPALRVFRQARFGEWAEAVARASEALARWRDDFAGRAGYQ